MVSPFGDGCASNRFCRLRSPTLRWEGAVPDPGRFHGKKKGEFLGKPHSWMGRIAIFDGPGPGALRGWRTGALGAGPHGGGPIERSRFSNRPPILNFVKVCWCLASRANAPPVRRPLCPLRAPGSVLVQEFEEGVASTGSVEQSRDSFENPGPSGSQIDKVSFVGGPFVGSSSCGGRRPPPTASARISTFPLQTSRGFQTGIHPHRDPPGHPHHRDLGQFKRPHVRTRLGASPGGQSHWGHRCHRHGPRGL